MKSPLLRRPVIAWALCDWANSAFATMHMFGLSHFFGHDLAEAQRCATGCVFFEAVMAFDDLDVDAGREVSQCCRGFTDQLHGEVDRQAHARGN